MTAAELAQVLIALGIGGVITSALQGWFQRKKVGGDYVTAVESSATRWVKAQEDRIVAAERRAEHAERSAQACHQRVTQLEACLREHDIPVPPPRLDVI